MGFLDGLFSSEKMQTAALGFLKKEMENANAGTVVLTLKDDGGFDIQMLKKEDKPVIYSESKIFAIQQAMIDYSKQVDDMRELFRQQDAQMGELIQENNRLVEMCKEQEQAILNQTENAANEHTDGNKE